MKQVKDRQKRRLGTVAAAGIATIDLAGGIAGGYVTGQSLLGK